MFSFVAEKNAKNKQSSPLRGMQNTITALNVH